MLTTVFAVHTWWTCVLFRCTICRTTSNPCCSKGVVVIFSDIYCDSRRAGPCSPLSVRGPAFRPVTSVCPTPAESGNCVINKHQPTHIEQRITTLKPSTNTNCTSDHRTDTRYKTASAAHMTQHDISRQTRCHACVARRHTLKTNLLRVTSFLPAWGPRYQQLPLQLDRRAGHI